MYDLDSSSEDELLKYLGKMPVRKLILSLIISPATLETVLKVASRLKHLDLMILPDDNAYNYFCVLERCQIYLKSFSLNLYDNVIETVRSICNFDIFNKLQEFCLSFPTNDQWHDFEILRILETMPFLKTLKIWLGREKRFAILNELLSSNVFAVQLKCLEVQSYCWGEFLRCLTDQFLIENRGKCRFKKLALLGKIPKKTLQLILSMLTGRHLHTLWIQQLEIPSW